MLNILYVNTLFDGGGAEKIAKCLFENIKNSHKATYITGFNKNSVPQNVKIIYAGLFKRVLNRLITLNHSNVYYNNFYSMRTIRRTIRKEKINLVHLHNIHGHYLGIKDIESICKMTKLVWTIHDCWLITGHCVSPLNCLGFENDCCSNCMHTEYYVPVNNIVNIRKMFEAKYNTFRNKGITFVAPSRWVKNQAEKYMLKGEKIEVIYNGINVNKFVQLDKNKVRCELHLVNTGKIYIGIIAADLSIKQKGMSVFLEAISMLHNRDNLIIVIAGGTGDIEDCLNELNVEFINLGYLHNENELSKFYSSVDLLVNPSLAESFGLVNIEAMSCGTPVLVMDIGPMREIVKDDVGWIADGDIPEALYKSMETILCNKNQLTEKASKCRQYIKENFSDELMIKRYTELYNKIICE